MKTSSISESSPKPSLAKEMSNIQEKLKKIADKSDDTNGTSKPRQRRVSTESTRVSSSERLERRERERSREKAASTDRDGAGGTREGAEKANIGDRLDKVGPCLVFYYCFFYF